MRGAVERLGRTGPTPRRGRRIGEGAVFVRCPYVLTDYFGIIVSAIAETLDLHGRPVILNAGEATQRSSVLPALPDRPGIGGAIMVLPPESTEDLERLRGRPFLRGRRSPHSATAGRSRRARPPTSPAPAG